LLQPAYYSENLIVSTKGKTQDCPAGTRIAKPESGVAAKAVLDKTKNDESRFGLTRARSWVALSLELGQSRSLRGAT
jgi:hypothetical protein